MTPAKGSADDPPVARVTASANAIPTDAPEAGGTLAWESTTLVMVEIEAGGEMRLGYTCSDTSLVALIADTLAEPRFRHLAWFHDHARIERMLFDGAPTPRGGCIAPDWSRPGFGLEFKARDAQRHRVQ